ncbi:SRPBCC family protein [Mycobacterium sp. SMC-2]|uniref:type II toxin-antitoxin system Rv0910 family toxin n=1 Tax=Mycobacterium sp. SMC-2 TaxID=2857058 RepID=UPI0021B2CC67|nr:SRPBCC family protein [Mycobacterium sp. SMC-2]UXA04269.1 SRPBCC family protein [Mycobacterium sp. SMC-2]
MAAVDLTTEMPMSPQEMWDRVSDLSDLGDWLVMHEGWRSDLPEELGEGAQVVGVARAKGFRNRVTWTVTTWDPPHQVALSGSGKGGAKYSVTLTVRAASAGSTLGLRLELGGRALFGPVGSAAARAVRGDVQRSLKNFVDLYG